MSRFAAADHVGVVEADEAIFVARLPDGPIIRLSGTAATIWTAALEHGDGPLMAVSEIVGISESVIAADVDAFISALIERGLLVNREAGRY